MAFPHRIPGKASNPVAIPSKVAFLLTLRLLKIIPLLVLLGIVWFFPESPRYLVKAGRDEEAQYILRRLRGSTGEDLVRANIEYQEIRAVISTESQEAQKTSYYHMFFGIGSGNLHTARRVQLVIWLQILQEWVGIAGVTVYAPTIFRVAGFVCSLNSRSIRFLVWGLDII